MKFIVDAQLPLRLARQLIAPGHEAVHTSELAQGNRARDTVLAAFVTRRSESLSQRTGTFAIAISVHKSQRAPKLFPAPEEVGPGSMAAHHAVYN